MSDFLDALAAARDEFRQDEYIHRVKTLVRAKIYELDEGALVEDTQYFNHSAIPDFIVSWRGEKSSRDLYLRGSYASILAADELTQTSSDSPVFMSLDETKDFSEEMPPISPQMIRDEPQKARETLLTDVTAMGEMLEPEANRVTPLTRLVQSSFFRGGRGLIDEARVESLIAAHDHAEQTQLTEIVRESFSEPAAARMERTATIVALALNGDSGALDTALDGLTGRLSDTELLEILPWLLRQETPIGSRDFWRRFGQMTSLSEIERIAPALEGLDIGPLIISNAESWQAQRSYLGVSSRLGVEEEDNDTSAGWRFRSGILGVDAGIHRVNFSSDGRTLRGRDDGTFPGWNELEENLSSFQLASVNLKGITRSVRIEAEKSDDIRQDVADVAQSLDDTYSVSDLGLRFSPRESKEGFASVSVNFGKGLAIASQGATIADLARSSLSVLAYRSPLSAKNQESVLGDAAAQSFFEVEESVLDDSIDENENAHDSVQFAIESEAVTEAQENNGSATE